MELVVFDENNNSGGQPTEETTYEPTDAERVACVSVDNLAYIDNEYNDSDMQQKVTNLVQEEMKRFTPPDYLKHRPLPSLTFGSCKLFKREFERVQKGVKLNSLDMSKYSLQPPRKYLRTDHNAWRSSVSQAQAQIMHQKNRILNLELLSKYGAKQWLAHIRKLTGVKKRLTSELETIQNDTENINRKRKAEQTELMPQLVKRTGLWWESIQRSSQLKAACESLEVELKRARSMCRNEN